MKQVTWMLALLLAISCSRNQSDDTSTMLQQGNWRVAFYWDEKDETSNFNSYTISFESGGVLRASKGGATVTGTWSQTSSRLNLSFTDLLLSDLNDDWLITEKTATSFKLKDDNPAQDDQLHLIKN